MSDPSIPNSELADDMAGEIAGDISANLAAVRQRMAAAAQRAGRDPADVALVAVSKTKPMWMIEAALAAGQLDFGENRLEEAWEKIEDAEAKGQSHSLAHDRHHPEP